MKTDCTKISWDMYETYCKCPQQFMWDHMTHKAYPTQGSKDTQYLVRGNAIQAIIDRWAKEGLWQQLDKQSTLDFVSANTIKEIRLAWIDDAIRGKPQISPMDMAVNIGHVLMLALPILKAHIYKQSRTEGPPKKILAQHTIKAPWSISAVHSLEARCDLIVVTQDNRGIIYEGKATKYPDQVSEEQVRWQAEILRHPTVMAELGIEVTTTHYYLFYNEAKFKDVGVAYFLPGDAGFSFQPTETQLAWLEERNKTIQLMLDGHYEARPTSHECHICKYNQVCPERYQVVPRSKEPALPPPVKPGARMNILD